MRVLYIAIVLASILQGAEPPAGRIAHSDPSQARASKAPHDGAGFVNIQSQFETGDLDTNLYFFHRESIPPKSGIGHHFHNQCEEMFIILDGEAEFTIDGRTSRLKGPAGAPARMGHSHAIYNPTDKVIQSLNINVAAMKGSYDAFNLGDGRANVTQLDPIPIFMTMRLDRTLLKSIDAMNGGKGSVQYRRAIDPTIFLGPWAYVDHLVVPPNSSTGAHYHNEVAEIYFVMAGDGAMTIAKQGRAASPETAVIRTGDAIAVQLSEIHSVENRGTAPLELMIVGVSRDSSKHVDSIDVRPASSASSAAK